MSEVKKVATRESYGNALKELGAEKADPKELAKKAVEIPGKLGNFLPLYEKDIVKIYKLMR